MEPPRATPFAGRSAELSRLGMMLDAASEGRGATILVTAEAGLGKTRLASEFEAVARGKGARTLRGAAAAESFRPFSLFAQALEADLGRPLFEEKVRVGFTRVVAVGRDGSMLAQSSGEGADSGEFATVLTAVQAFVRDSFAGDGSGLGRLEFGRTKVMMEHGSSASIAAVFECQEHPQMRSVLRSALSDAETGIGFQSAVDAISRAEFLVRRDLDANGLKAERFRISNLILEKLAVMASKAPVVLILEDLHWADESSLFVLDFIARNLRGTGLLVIGTARPQEGEAAMATAKRMLSEGTAEELRLERLPEASLFDIIDGHFRPNTFPGDFRERLASNCGGNPFFLMETLRQLETDGSVAMGASGYEVMASDCAVPATVEEAVNRRIRNLDEEALALSEFLSCVGRSFSLEIVFGAGPSREPAKSLEDLCRTQVIAVDGSRGEFTHAIVQSVVYGGMAERWRATHHKSIGEYLEARHVSDREAVVFELARHFSKTRENAKAFDYACLAGNLAAETFAPEQALVYYTSAESLSSKVKPHPGARLMEVVSGTASVLALLGRYDESLARYESILSESQDALEKARILGRMSAVLTLKSDYDRAWDASEQGLALLGGRDDGEKARILHTMGRLRMRRGDLQGAKPYIDECIAIAVRLDDDSLVAMAEVMAGVLEALQGRHSDAIAHYAKAIKINEARGDISALAGALNNKGLAHYGMGEIDAAYEHHIRSLAIKRRIGDRYAIAGSLINLGLVHFDRGELDEALEKYDESFAIKEKLGDRYGLTLLHLYIANVYSHKGSYEEAKRHYDEVLRLSGETKDKHQLADILYNIGRLHFAKGEYPEAVRNFEEAARVSDEIKAYHLAVFSHLRLVETWVSAGNLPEARRHWGAASEMREVHFGKDDFDVFMHPKAMLAAAEGDWAGAEIAFQEAIRKFDASKKRKELAFALLEYGRNLKARGDTGAGQARIAEARDHFDAMGMSDWSRKARDALSGK